MLNPKRINGVNSLVIDLNEMSEQELDDFMPAYKFMRKPIVDDKKLSLAYFDDYQRWYHEFYKTQQCKTCK